MSGKELGRQIAVALMALSLVACGPRAASPPHEPEIASPHPDLDAAWRDFLALPAQRAMAIAGDPRRDRWVAGASGGHATRGQAEAEALAECLRRRGIRRLQAACVLYAVGDEVVWRGP